MFFLLLQRDDFDCQHSSYVPSFMLFYIIEISDGFFYLLPTEWSKMLCKKKKNKSEMKHWNGQKVEYRLTSDLACLGEMKKNEGSWSDVTKLKKKSQPPFHFSHLGTSHFLNLNLKNKAKVNWVLSSSKGKHYFLNMLYQRVKFWHGLFFPSWWTIRNSEIWLQILDITSPTLLLINLPPALHQRKSRDTQLTLGEHK